MEVASIGAFEARLVKAIMAARPTRPFSEAAARALIKQNCSGQISHESAMVLADAIHWALTPHIDERAAA